MINLENIKTYKEPYTHFIIDEAFSNKDFENMVSEFPNNELFGNSQGGVNTNRKCVANTAKNNIFDDWIESAPTWKKFYEYLNSPQMIQDMFPLFMDEFRKYGSKLDLSQLNIDVNGPKNFDFNSAAQELYQTGTNKDQNNLWIQLDMLRAYDGYKREIHHDMHYRVINFLAFFSDAEGDGGEFRIHDNLEETAMADHARQPSGIHNTDDSRYPVVKSIKPQKNKLLGFVSSPNSYHSVSELKNYEGFRDFIYVGISCKGAMAWHKNGID